MGQEMNQASELFLLRLRRSVADKKAAGVGMTEIAYHCGLSVTILYDYLKGKSVPRLPHFVRMAHYFGWDPMQPGPSGTSIRHRQGVVWSGNSLAA